MQDPNEETPLEDDDEELEKPIYENGRFGMSARET